METIHLKTVDPISQELLRSASQQGLELPWERFEKLQPQDGFLRLGLSCPFGCMHGPCRIDPFGRGPEKGVCGLAREEMVAGLLLRLCLQGTMEALAGVPSDDGLPAICYSSTLGSMVSQALSANNEPDLSLADIFKTTVLLSRPSATCRQLLSQALRLSLLTLGFQEQSGSAASAASLPCTTGYATLTGGAIRIGVSGRPSSSLLSPLGQEVKAVSTTPVQLVSLGDWIVLESRILPIACTTGESELLLGSGAIHLLVAGAGTDPGLISLCEKMNIPVVADGQDGDAREIIGRARNCFASRSQLDLFSDAPLIGENRVLMSGGDLEQVSGWDLSGPVALIGGSDTPQLSLGNLPVDLAHGLSEKGCQLGGWGDAALWVLKKKSSAEEVVLPFQTLDNRQGALPAVTGLAAAGKIGSLQGICFTGMKSCLELASALGLASVGCRVSAAIPLPLQGSRTVADALSALLGKNGGELRHFDHPADAQELLEWLLNP